MVKITKNIVKEMKMIQALILRTKVIKSYLCDYSETYILVTGDITAIDDNANTNITFQNCVPFIRA